MALALVTPGLNMREVQNARAHSIGSHSEVLGHAIVVSGLQLGRGGVHRRGDTGNFYRGRAGADLQLHVGGAGLVQFHRNVL